MNYYVVRAQQCIVEFVGYGYPRVCFLSIDDLCGVVFFISSVQYKHLNI